ncbi:MAG: hypothetical protein Q9184_005880 [Pyrenodesmia sp. 2 TL-2023]
MNLTENYQTDDELLSESAAFSNPFAHTKKNKEIKDAKTPARKALDKDLLPKALTQVLQEYRCAEALVFVHGIWAQALTLSHVTNEAEHFVPTSVLTDAQFAAFVTGLYPPSASAGGVIAAIEAPYPISPQNNYTTQRARLRDLPQEEASFVCNVRTLSEAYAGKNYNLQYAGHAGAARHRPPPNPLQPKPRPRHLRRRRQHTARARFRRLQPSVPELSREPCQDG